MQFTHVCTSMRFICLFPDGLPSHIRGVRARPDPHHALRDEAEAVRGGGRRGAEPHHLGAGLGHLVGRREADGEVDGGAAQGVRPGLRKERRLPIRGRGRLRRQRGIGSLWDADIQVI